jgi:TetR/AcrR family transcriptional regulator, transcriptional repressor for nem operon
MDGNKRDRLVRAAAELSYGRGFGDVALADIAEHARVPVGNIYYYFRTKASIGEAVVAQRRAEFQMMRQLWDSEPTPQRRLKALVRMTRDNRDNLARAGCPVGSLCSELGKQEGPLAEQSALPLRDLLQWIEQQFEEMGKAAEKEALGLHLLSALQGVSLLANGLRNSKLVETEARLLNRWIDSLADRKA